MSNRVGPCGTTEEECRAAATHPPLAHQVRAWPEATARDKFTFACRQQVLEWDREDALAKLAEQGPI